MTPFSEMSHRACSNTERVAYSSLRGLLFASLWVACTPSSPVRSDCDGQRIIVVTAPGLGTAVTELDAVFSQETGAPVHFMRTLFENQHLFCVEGARDESGLSLVMDKLIRLSDVQSVEVDRLRKPQSRYP